MKKYIFAVCIVVMVAVLASAAMASSASWVLKFKVGTRTSDTATTLGAYGNVSLGSDIALVETAASAPSSGTCNIAAVGTTGAYNKVEQIASADTMPYTYTLRLAIGTGVTIPAGTPGKVWVTLWAPDSFGGNAGWDIPDGYSVTVTGNGVNKSYTNADIARASDPTISGIAANGFWYTFGARANTYDASNDNLTVTVGSVPEPGSLLALGSGLIGLAGFAIRRRRA